MRTNEMISTDMAEVKTELDLLVTRRQELQAKIAGLEDTSEADLDAGQLALVAENNAAASRDLNAKLDDIDAAEAALQARRESLTKEAFLVGAELEFHKCVEHRQSAIKKGTEINARLEELDALLAEFWVEQRLGNFSGAYKKTIFWDRLNRAHPAAVGKFDMANVSIVKSGWDITMPPPWIDKP